MEVEDPSFVQPQILNSEENIIESPKTSDVIAPLDLHRSPSTSSVVSEIPEPLNKSTDSLKSRKSATPTKNRRKRKPVVTKKVSPEENEPVAEDAMDIETDLPSTLIACQHNFPAKAISLLKETKSTESDECETIDKIAQMVSNITSDQVSIPSAPVLNKQTIDDIELRLEEMLGEGPSQNDPKISNAIDAAVSLVDSTKQDDVAKKKPNRKKKTDGPIRKRPSAAEKKASKNGKTPKNTIKLKTDIKSSPDKKLKPKENGSVVKARVRPVKADVAPFLQIDKNGSFTIVNQTANGDEDTEKLINKTKKVPVADKNKHRAIRGLHVSTLSNKYDADKRDATWICVFCKVGPHKVCLGDLFGPYFITKNSEEYQMCLQDPENDIFRQSNSNKLSKSPLSTPSPEKSKKKRKIAISVPEAVIAKPTSSEPGEEIFAGMLKIDENTYEVWFHEDCIVWASGVYIIGTKIMGLDAAVWSSTRYTCTYCHKNGAMISCLTKGCRKQAHIVCARRIWKFTDDFKTFCDQHC